MKIHIEAVHKKTKSHVCEECGYAASQKSNLKQHLANVHEKMNSIEYVHKIEKRHFKCEQCGYAARHKGNLNQHIEEVHKKVKKYFCAVCRYAASRNSVLKKHMEAKYESKKHVICHLTKELFDQSQHN